MEKNVPHVTSPPALGKTGLRISPLAVDTCNVLKIFGSSPHLPEFRSTKESSPIINFLVNCVPHQVCQQVSFSET